MATDQRELVARFLEAAERAAALHVDCVAAETAVVRLGREFLGDEGRLLTDEQVTRATLARCLAIAAQPQEA